MKTFAATMDLWGQRLLLAALLLCGAAAAASAAPTPSASGPQSAPSSLGVVTLREETRVTMELIRPVPRGQALVLTSALGTFCTVVHTDVDATKGQLGFLTSAAIPPRAAAGAGALVLRAGDAGVPSAAECAARPAQTDEKPRTAAERRGPSSLTARLRGFYSGSLGGGILHAAFESNRAFLFGGRIDLLLSGAFTMASLRLDLGYGQRHFALALSLGSGYPIWYPMLGFMVRAGRIDGHHVRARLGFWVFPSPFPSPSDADLEINLRLSPRHHMTLQGGQPLNLPGFLYALVGARHVVSRGPTGAHLLTWGLGIAGPSSAPYLGGIASLGYQHLRD